MTTQIVASVASVGNSETTRIDNRKSQYIFTFNNYNPDNVASISLALEEICKKFIFQSEVGEATKTPHLQGYMFLKKKMSMECVNKLFENKLHLEVCKKPKKAIEYCHKDDTYDGKFRMMKGIKLKKKLNLIEKLYPWQKSLYDFFLTEPDDRAVVWIYNKQGGIGKSQFSKYCQTHLNCLTITHTKLKDVACELALKTKNDDMFDMNDKLTLIFDLPRDYGIVNYTTIECLKNGLITSAKYESKTLIFNAPHICIMSNSLPDWGAMSKDRFLVYEITEKMGLKKYIRPVAVEPNCESI